jgi:hydroxyethylthiazole kinase
MAHAVDEVEEMTGLASALVLNIGTLSGPWIEAMFLAAGAARRKGIPIVLDPVGAGATRFRTETARRLLVEARPAIVRGNASEIMALAHLESATKGVESRHGAEAAVETARSLSAEFGCVVSVSGPVDHILLGGSLVRVLNGHPLMPRVTGLGCAATALSGAFAAVSADPFAAAVRAMAVMGIAGEMAAERAAGPGSFQVAFFDALYRLSESDVRTRLRLEEG